jgi:uncharacterized membrane protein
MISYRLRMKIHYKVTLISKLDANLKTFKRKAKLKILLTWLFAIIMIVAGFLHFTKPTAYAAFIPDWLPLYFINYLVGIIETGIGICLLITNLRGYAAICLVLLMIFFLPFHAIDAFKTHPAIGSPIIAWIRLPLQFLLIYWAWFIRPYTK